MGGCGDNGFKRMFEPDGDGTTKWVLLVVFVAYLLINWLVGNFDDGSWLPRDMR